MSISYSLSRTADHRDLHSFPTRRSSDLAGSNDAGTLLPSASAGRFANLRAIPTARNRWSYRQTKSPEEIRSEEHTSELQSLTNLVCRLLLEKKKKKNQTNIPNKTQ